MPERENASNRRPISGREGDGFASETGRVGREEPFAVRLAALRREVGDNELMRDLTPEGVKEMLAERD